MQTVKKDFNTNCQNAQILKREYITDNGLSNVPGEPPKPEEVFHCELWITQYCKPRKTINPLAFSYSLKHWAENWNSELSDNCKYVTNGAFIQAAIRLGYKYKQDGFHDPNVYFNMSISKLAKEAV